MKTGIKLFLPLVILLLMASNTFAHPGRTASDGCHYCRTNCASWGEVYGARHCHGGGNSPAPVYYTLTPVPTSTPYPTATSTPTHTPTPTIINLSAVALPSEPASEVTTEPEVKANSDESTDETRILSTSTSSDDTSGSILGDAIVVMLLAFAGWAVKKRIS